MRHDQNHGCRGRAIGVVGIMWGATEVGKVGDDIVAEGQAV
jgi:hypothetical protein